MSLVEIACFVEEEHAQLAARFLRRHGVKTTVPVMYFRWKVDHPHRVFVGQGQAEKATELLRKVASGEFADADPDENTGRGLGAALAESVLPAPGFRRLSLLEGLGPLIAIVVFGVVAYLGPVIYRIVTTRGSP